MTEEKNLIIDKFIIIETWAFRGRHWIDRLDMNTEKAIFCVKRLKDELAILEDKLGMK